MSGVTPEPSPARKTASNLGYGFALLVAAVVLFALLTGNTATPFGLPPLNKLGPFIPPAAGIGAYYLSRLLFSITLKTNQ